VSSGSPELPPAFLTAPLAHLPEAVLAAVARLNADLGTTVLLAEHRLERAAPIADEAVLVERGRLASSPAAMSCRSCSSVASGARASASIMNE